MKNILYCGDNIEILQREIKKNSIDLIYIDPPFFSNKQYAVVWGDEAEIRSFEDRWAGGIENYIAWMKPRVEAMHRVLKPTGSFYLHCDWHAGHYLKVMCDDVFGYNNFRNEIVWCYDKWIAPSNNFQKNHDIILRYSKTKDWTFNVIREIDDRRAITLERGYTTNLLKNGERQLIVYRGSENKENIKKLIKSKKFIRVIYKEPEGNPLKDHWRINIIHPKAKERLGYPTQKPESLLERIIKASSNKGNLVLDAFCGCGTAMAVAHKLKRNWIGIDISPTAIKLVERRLRKIGAVKDEHYKSIGLPTTIKELEKLEPFEFQNWVLDEMGGIVSRKLVGDKGINGHLPQTLWHEQAGIQVKQSERVGRNVIDNFETALRRKKYVKGYVIAFSFGRGAKEEVARLKNKKELDITLITVKELLNKKKTLLK